MNAFRSFTKTALTHTLQVLGEPASIGGDQFLCAFSEARGEITSHAYGDEDDSTLYCNLLSSAVSNTPRVGETLTRINERKTYVILEVSDDIESYELQLRRKDG
jgi:hypothetical protein